MRAASRCTAKASCESKDEKQIASGGKYAEITKRWALLPENEGAELEEDIKNKL